MPGAGRCDEAAAADSPSAVPSARRLVDDVIASLPHEPLLISGDILVRLRRGVVVREYGFEMLMQLGGDPPRSRYRVFDPDGRELERLSVTRRAGAPPRLEYAVAGRPVPRAPDLFANIQSTDLAWIDLTLSFLWWQGGEVLGEERVKGRTCYVVSIPTPERLAAGGDEAYASVRLWVDAELHMLLQAEARDAAGEPIRRLWVKSLKKVNDRWMIKDMEVQEYPAVHRTKLRIQDVEPAG